MKSHVGMEQKVCMVCGQTFDTGAILLDRRLKDTLERYNVTGWGICPEHEKMWEDGFVALVECDEEKSKVRGGVIKPEDAYRTGNICHLKKTAFEQVFGQEATTPVAFIQPGVIEKLQEMTEGDGVENTH